ncbi:hypothetical protein CTAYLR_007353 [Chrysophaeum taylorii]|uniref:Histone chaperone RTT106/FACT complex subunit SPT16-like middle domain-containing protein n=1 Tax=Chrysophaeum taylorii TaxID=2483200 RepID=A0AAD7UI28_9STRA|nr:hypothetical protein CTAYLR_007353 [Chrysophaeum taylorii]
MADEEALVTSLEELVAEKKVSDPKKMSLRLQQLAQRCVALCAPSVTTDVGEVVLDLEIACLQPRGTFRVIVGKAGCVVGEKIGFSWDEVMELFLAPSSETETAQDVAFCTVATLRARSEIEASTKAAKAEFQQRCVVFAAKKKMVDPPDEFFASLDLPPKKMTAQAAVAVALSTLAKKPLRQLLKGSKDRFLTSATGAPYLRASLGAAQGHLALVPSGILFLKPCVFLPVGLLGSVSCGRAGGASHASASFFDLTVDMDPPFSEGNVKSPTFEFSNISKDELPALQRFLTQVLLPARDNKPGASDHDDDDDGDDDDDDDDDFDPDATDDENRQPLSDDDDDDDREEEEEEEEEDFVSDDGLQPGGLEDENDEPVTKKRRGH